MRLFERAKELVSALRAGEGPAFVEVMTYRWQEHVGPNTDFQLGYRTREEAQPWQDNDQVTRLARMIDARHRACIEADVEEELRGALHFAMNSPYPEKAELYADVYQ